MLDLESGLCGCSCIADVAIAIVAFKQAFLYGRKSLHGMLELADICYGMCPTIHCGFSAEMLYKVKELVFVSAFHGTAQIVAVHDLHFVV